MSSVVLCCLGASGLPVPPPEPPAWSRCFQEGLADLEVTVRFTAPESWWPSTRAAGYEFFHTAVDAHGRRAVLEELVRAVGHPETLAQAHLLLVREALWKTYAHHYWTNSARDYFGLRYDARIGFEDSFEVPDAAAQAVDLQRRWWVWLNRPDAEGTDFYPLPTIESNPTLEYFMRGDGAAPSDRPAPEAEPDDPDR